MKKTIKIVALALVAVMCVAMLASCFGPKPNSDPEKAKAALEENGYTVSDIPLNYKGLDTVVFATKGLLSEDNVTILYFIDKESAEDAFEDIRQDEVDEEDEENENYICEQSGKMVYFGHKNAIKAAK